MTNRTVEHLPKSKKVAYAIGQLGWSTLMNIVSLQMLYFYIPPEGAGIPIYITQAVFLVVLNAIMLIAASGRLFDAVTDPLIAGMSDNWKGKNGRRIPFLKVGALPTALFCCLIFVPIVNAESYLNIAWLVLIQLLFYISLTVYVTPYFALLPELGHSSDERLDLSMLISITYALGAALASFIPAIADAFAQSFGIVDKVLSLQVAVAFLAFLSLIFMWVPAFTIEEKRYCKESNTKIPVITALKRTFKNKNFIYYVVADFAYFTGFTILMTGLLYYITVLLGMEEKMMGVLLPLLVLVSFIFYPFVNILGKKLGKKILVITSFLWMGVVFCGIYFLGNLPMSTNFQAYGLILSLAVPISFLGVLPNAILADIAEHDAMKSGIKQEGMYFAARTLMQKFGQTFGVIIFAMLTSLGKDPGDDLGIRLSGVIAATLCILAGLYFIKYDEKQLLSEMEKLEKN